MNLALLFEEDFVAPDRVRLRGRRLEHLKTVL
ncbi:MAG TPA: 16S rRNA (uracil(1498)-N(3))-methyltransferase, partial [Marinobacter hydrocarbonoclasticus]|nr:16S rRNA (uracil(1498)-N(3))-methyltransferase [Marinobacter nauticus]